MTDSLRETVERLDKLHKEATPGPIATDRTEHTYSRCVFGERGEGVREWVAHYMSQPNAEFTAAIFNAWPQLSAALQAGWVSVEERLPESTVNVLAHYRNELGKKRTVRAFYAPRFTVDDRMDDDEDHCTEEHDGTTYLPEGWYEECDNAEHYYRIHRPVTHWQPLPAPPEKP